MNIQDAICAFDGETEGQRINKLLHYLAKLDNDFSVDRSLYRNDKLGLLDIKLPPEPKKNWEDPDWHAQQQWVYIYNRWTSEIHAAQEEIARLYFDAAFLNSEDFAIQVAQNTKFSELFDSTFYSFTEVEMLRHDGEKGSKRVTVPAHKIGQYTVTSSSNWSPYSVGHETGYGLLPDNTSSEKRALRQALALYTFVNVNGLFLEGVAFEDRILPFSIVSRYRGFNYRICRKVKLPQRGKLRYQLPVEKDQS